ncbi:MAG: DivIVA domain-containing protein [Christensenellales bacterium]|jgi:cell division initiation protein
MAQITPEMIGEKSFSSQFRGYNMDEVDDFLDEITEELTNQLRNQKELNGRILELQQELAEVSQNAGGSQETTQLQALLRASRQRIAELEAEQKSGGAGDPALRKQLEDANKQIAQLRSRPAGNAELEEQYAIAKKRIAQLEAMIGEPEKLMSQLDADLQAKFDAASAETEAMVKKAKDETDAQLAQTKDALAKAYKEYNDLTAQVADLKTRYIEMLENQMKLMG